MRTAVYVLCTVVLYQGHGIVLFEDITRDPEYYVYHEEMEILARHGSSIVSIYPHFRVW